MINLVRVFGLESTKTDFLGFPMNLFKFNEHKVIREDIKQ